MVEKRNIFLVGPMGAGKSTIGKQLSKQLHMEFFDSDSEIEKRTGADISWVFDLEGEKGFRKREKKIIDELTQRKGIILATGGGSILSCKIRNFLSSRGVVIYLKTTIDKQILRTQKDKKRPLLQVKTSSVKTVLEKLKNLRGPLYKQIADITLSTDKYSIKSVVFKILRLLEQI
ncbi:shikimate kinase AroK [Buchnera aphidicola (Mollitrichosiphum nigrofasciatum)]|uniref:shikimate kinase AroK n=1 Tax=Buchnera aphidicola TaxID=9 RepID=UPI0031B857F9